MTTNVQDRPAGSAPVAPATPSAKTASLTTAIAMVIDRSQSMESCRAETIVAINKYLLEARADENLREADLSLMIFDSTSIDTIRSGVVSTIADLTSEDFIPRSSTPLYDAVGRGVEMLDAKKSGKAILVIVTDGFENSSRKYTHASVTALIKARQEAGWLVVFLGAGNLAAAQGLSMGINAGTTASFGTSGAELSATMDSVATMNSGYSSTRSLGEARSYAKSAAFSAADRSLMSVGDGHVGVGGAKSLAPVVPSVPFVASHGSMAVAAPAPGGDGVVCNGDAWDAGSTAVLSPLGWSSSTRSLVTPKPSAPATKDHWDAA